MACVLRTSATRTGVDSVSFKPLAEILDLNVLWCKIILLLRNVYIFPCIKFWYFIPAFCFQNQYNYLIGGLMIWKNYEIQVAGYNIKGVGVYSRSIQIKTKEGVPAASPKEVEAEAISSTSIKVSWKPPDPWMINGINQGYKLQAWQGKYYDSLKYMSLFYKTLQRKVLPYELSVYDHTSSIYLSIYILGYYFSNIAKTRYAYTHSCTDR